MKAIKKLYVLISPPCGGKTTWIKTNKDSLNNPFIFSTDDLIATMYPNIPYSEAWSIFDDKEGKKILREGLNDAVKNGDDIVIDRMNLRIKSRIYYLNSVGKKYQKIAIVFPWDKETFIERNKKRQLSENKYISLGIWEECCTQYQIPTKEEGFDEIIFL